MSKKKQIVLIIMFLLVIGGGIALYLIFKNNELECEKEFKNCEEMQEMGFRLACIPCD